MTGYDGGVRRLVVLVTALAGCSFSGPESSGTFACSAAAPECPPGTTCIEGRCTTASDAAPEPTGFRFRRRLAFDNRERGTVAGFPVLVALDPGVFDYGGAADGGADLRFFDVDQAPLPHEIEIWNPGGVSFVWVRVPEITGNSDQDHIWLYYGHSTPPAPAGDDVWSAYQVVDHLGASVDDSAALMLDGVESGTEVIAGRIGQGRRFNGTSDHVRLGPDPPVLRGVRGMTLEAWVSPAGSTASDADQVVVAVTAHQADFSRAQIKIDPTGSVRAVFRTQDSGMPNAVYTLDTPLPMNEWTWVVASVDLTEGKIRISLEGGQQVGATTTANLDPMTVDTSPDQVLISLDETGGEWYAGALDELRIAGAAMSEDWLAVQYASMTGALVTFDPPEEL